MDSSTQQNGGGQMEAAKRIPKRIKKLSGDELAGLPGVNPAPIKVSTSMDTYSIVFSIGLEQEVGTSEEINRCAGFINELDQHAKSSGVGKVTGAHFDHGGFEAVLELTVNDKPESNSIPIKNAFERLNDFIQGADILKQGLSGTPATWKAKVRNTTVVEGRF